MTLLIVVGADDRVRRCALLALRGDRYDVRTVHRIEDCGSVLRRRQVDGIVLASVDAPCTDGIRDVRNQTGLPMVVVAEGIDAAARVRSLDAGADDCLDSPFDVEEFLARLRAASRRFERSVVEDLPLQTDDFALFLGERRCVRADGSEAPLSPTEWRVVEVLARRPGHLLTQESILRSVWGDTAVHKFGLLRVHLASIRRKVEPDPTQPQYFITVPGLGIRFVPVVLDAQASAS